MAVEVLKGGGGRVCFDVEGGKDVGNFDGSFHIQPPVVLR